MGQGGSEAVFSNRTEVAFHRWGALVIRHRWIAILIPLLVTGYMVSYLPHLSIDNSTEGFLPQDDPATVRYNEYRSRFDRDDRIILAIGPQRVFEVDFLERLRLLHLALEAEAPYVEEVTSLFNVRSTRGEADELIVEGLLEGWLDEWPADLSALEGLQGRVFANPLYVNTLVSEDASLTTVTIKPFTYSNQGDDDALSGFEGAGASRVEPGEEPLLLTAKENDALLAAIRGVMERFDSPEFPIHIGGPLAVSDHINRSMARDIGIMVALCIVVILTLLYALFRRLSGAVLPLMVVSVATLAAVGVMIALEIPGTTAVQILPVFLLTVGICDAVHILVITYQRLEAGDEKSEAIAYAIGHSGLAVVMTSVTTAAGMASFITAEMVPVSHLGIIAPIGVMLALAYSLVLLPAFLSVMPLSPSRRSDHEIEQRWLVRTMVRAGEWAADYPKQVLAGTAIFALVCLAGALQVRFSHLALVWFDPDDPIRVATELIDEKLRGSMALEVVVYGGSENALQDPGLLHRIEEAMHWAEGIEQGDVFVGKAVSIVDIVKETHQALNENHPDFRALPSDRGLIAQELLLFESGGADDLEEWVDSQFTSARISLRAPFVDALHYGPFMQTIGEGMREILGDDVEIELTGFMPVLAGVISAVIVSMARSYAFALLIITPLMILLLRNLRLGMLSMIPNLLPVIFVLGVMGWADIPLDATNIMIGAMVIGLAVDDTIHFMHKFRLYFAESGDARSAIRETLSSTGAALLFTTLVLTGGFMTITFASMANTRTFGLLAALATLVAFLADIIVGPALMTLAVGRKPQSEVTLPSVARAEVSA